MPGGVLVAIVPDSILTNRGIYKDLRKGIAAQVELCSVTSLPIATFGAAGTTTKTSVLHLRKTAKKPEATSRVYFAECQSIGYEISTRGAQRRKVRNGKNELEKILPEVCGKAESAQTVGRWLDFATAEQRWDVAYQASLPRELQSRLSKPRRNDCRVSQMATLVNDRFNPLRLGNQTFYYIEISDVDAESCTVRAKPVLSSSAPSRARKKVKSGDVLVSTVRPERRAIGVVPPALDGAVCSTGFGVLRPKGIAPLVLARLLQSEFANAQIMRHNAGIAYPAIDETCLLGIVLPINLEEAGALESEARTLSSLRQNDGVLG